MGKLIIRYAEKEELEAVNKIRKQVNDVHVIGCSDVFRNDGWQFIEPFVYKRFEEENSNIIVADIDGEIVGFAVIQYIVKPESPFGKERRYLHIEEFGVDKNHRRKGIATAIINFVKEDAKSVLLFVLFLHALTLILLINNFLYLLYVEENNLVF
jgi:GNAT superfamily N-acetyltransferase